MLEDDGCSFSHTSARRRSSITATWRFNGTRYGCSPAPTLHLPIRVHFDLFATHDAFLEPQVVLATPTPDRAFPTGPVFELGAHLLAMFQYRMGRMTARRTV